MGEENTVLFNDITCISNYTLQYCMATMDTTIRKGFLRLEIELKNVENDHKRHLLQDTIHQRELLTSCLLTEDEKSGKTREHILV